MILKLVPHFPANWNFESLAEPTRREIVDMAEDGAFAGFHAPSLLLERNANEK
jgi:hypothetical protein